MKKQE